MKIHALILVAVFSLSCSDSGSSADAMPLTDADVAPTWDNFANQFLTTYCHDCHGPGDTLRDFSLIDMVRLEQAKIRCGVSPTTLTPCTIPAGMFPIGAGPQPSDAERNRLVRWIDEGAVQ